jgi:hypothetical protein
MVKPLKELLYFVTKEGQEDSTAWLQVAGPRECGAVYKLACNESKSAASEDS